jgi:hypothetical protein
MYFSCTNENYFELNFNVHFGHLPQNHTLNHA